MERREKRKTNSQNILQSVNREIDFQNEQYQKVDIDRFQLRTNCLRKAEFIGWMNTYWGAWAFGFLSFIYRSLKYIRERLYVDFKTFTRERWTLEEFNHEIIARFLFLLAIWVNEIWRRSKSNYVSTQDKFLYWFNVSHFAIVQPHAIYHSFTFHQLLLSVCTINFNIGIK